MLDPCHVMRSIVQCGQGSKPRRASVQYRSMIPFELLSANLHCCPTWMLYAMLEPSLLFLQPQD